MKKLHILVVLLTLMSITNINAKQKFNIDREIPYQDKLLIDTRVLDECTTLGADMSTYIAQYAQEMDVDISQIPASEALPTGNYVQLQIASVISRGNAFVGHKKSIQLIARLIQDGRTTDSRNFFRDSSGGFTAGVSSSCDVLNRCAKALGKDVAKWLKNKNS